MPIVDKIDKITVVEPSDERAAEVHGKELEYVIPAVDGRLEFENGSFDLVTSFGTLHHIPNVSTVLMELGRVCESGGHLILREPVISMGDWRRPRAGLTPHERGIPEGLLRTMLADAGFELERVTPCGFPGLNSIIERRLKLPPVQQTWWGVRLDEVLSRIFWRNTTYHATRLHKKLRATVLVIVARKRL